MGIGLLTKPRKMGNMRGGNELPGKFLQSNDEEGEKLTELNKP